MPRGSSISIEIKTEILKKIKDEGLTVIDASKQYGINPKSIYNWLKVGITPGITVLDNNKLRRENAQLLLTIGLLTAEITKSKKGAVLGNWLTS